MKTMEAHELLRELNGPRFHITRFHGLEREEAFSEKKALETSRASDITRLVENGLLLERTVDDILAQHKITSKPVRSFSEATDYFQREIENANEKKQRKEAKLVELEKSLGWFDYLFRDSGRECLRKQISMLEKKQQRYSQRRSEVGDLAGLSAYSFSITENKYIETSDLGERMLFTLAGVRLNQGLMSKYSRMNLEEVLPWIGQLKNEKEFKLVNNVADLVRGTAAECAEIFAEHSTSFRAMLEASKNYSVYSPREIDFLTDNGSSISISPADFLANPFFPSKEGWQVNYPGSILGGTPKVVDPSFILGFAVCIHRHAGGVSVSYEPPKFTKFENDLGLIPSDATNRAYNHYTETTIKYDEPDRAILTPKMQLKR